MQRKTSPVGNLLVIDALIFENRKAFGYQEYLFNLLDYFFEKREYLSYERVIVVCPENQMQFFQKYQECIDIVGFRVKNKMQHLIAQNVFERKLKLKKTDTVLFTYNYSSFFKCCRHILVIHDLLYLRKKYLPNKRMRYQRKISVPISLCCADKIIAISEFTKKDILGHYKVPEDKIITIYNYFNFEKYTLTERYFKCPRPYFISVCSTAYHKNTITVLKAFERFCKTNSNTDIVFIGGLEDKSSEAYIFYESLPDDNRKRIHFLADVSNSELGMIYRNAKCFISLTLFEGLGMPIVEAMYFNLPLILSNLEVCREIASGATVQFVDPFDIEQIVIAMHKNADSNASVSSCDLVKERFLKENTSGKYIDLLNA